MRDTSRQHEELPEEHRLALAEHDKWLATKGEEGAQLNWAGAELLRMNLRGANLDMADLRGADLRGANLREANLSGAKLEGANLTHANPSAADLTGVKLTQVRLENARLHDVRGLWVDGTFVRGAQFSMLGSAWWTFLCNRVLAPLNRTFAARGWEWLARRFEYRIVYRDPWSVLRQTYAGPRAFYLFFYVILFVLPYAGRAAFYSTVGTVEQKLVDWADARKRQLRQELDTGPLAGGTTQTVRVRVPDETVTVAVEGKPVSVVLPPKDIEVPISGSETRRTVEKKELEALEAVERRVEPRPLWQVVLRWDEGRPWPTILAVLLIVYNVGVYWLVTSVGPLRDEEERSGWSPRWADYRALVWVHIGVTALFYVSVVSFIWNLWELLQHPVRVWLPAGA